MRRLPAIVSLLLAFVLPAAAQTTTTTTTTSTTSTTVQTCALAVTGFEVWIVNETDQSTITLDVDGDLAADALTCTNPPSPFSSHYSATLTCSGTGLVRCTGGTLTGLRPGAWIHRMSVQVPGTDAQSQSRRGVLIAGTGSQSVANRVVWTVYGFARQVTTATATALRTAVDEAAAYTAAHADRHALVMVRPSGPITLDQHVWTTGPNVGQTRCPADLPCSASPKAGLCLTGDRIVLDGRDDDASRTAELNVGSYVHPVVRIYGDDVELRGLVLRGSQVAQGTQADTVAFMGGAERSAVNDCLVYGPTEGDAVSSQCSAGGSDANANILVDSRVEGAEDKGVKVASGATQLVTNSCLVGNRNGGVQATLGGRVLARENVVQHNVANEAENGIFANDSAGTPSSVDTRGNIVRFAGNRGLSVADNAIGVFRDDYVARNQYAGARVETTRSGVQPQATFTGVAFVCNAVPDLSATCSSPVGQPCLDATDCDPGATCTTTFPVGLGLSVGFDAAGACACTSSPCPCTAPVVTLGDGSAESPENALALNKLATGGRNLSFDVPGATLAAGNTQWQWGASCGGSGTFTESEIAACNVATAAGASVTLPPLLLAGTGTPTMTEVSPARPRAGEIVRVYGRNFDAIEGNQISTACHAVPDRNADFCDPSVHDQADQELAAANRQGDANRLRLRRGTQAWDLDLVAVTPTMLAFRMPVDCFQPSRLTLNLGAQAAQEIDLCDVDGCAGQPAGVGCLSDGFACTDDVCDGAGACIHPPTAAGTTCRAATDLCDAPEVCDGTATTCPADAKRPSGYECRAAVDLCDKAEVCSGTSKTCPTDAIQPSGFTCRAVAGTCDVVEKCDGAGTACPADVVKAAGTTCRAAAGSCDLAETCDGAGAACPADAVKPSSTVCRTSKGECDPAETCTGSSGACPADAKSTALCREAAGTCDVAEFCNGSANTCPADAKASGTVCRAATGVCDAAETCDGTSDACPADALRPAGSVCRAASAACDAAETCDGTTDACPADAVKAQGAICRAAADACDLVETCDGGAAACPADVTADGFDGVSCRLLQLDAAVDGACASRRQSLTALLTRTSEALEKARIACDAGRAPSVRRFVRKAAAGAARIRKLVAGDACLRATASRWTTLAADAESRAKVLRAAAATSCPPPAS